VALFPIPILAVILLLLSPRPAPKVLAFLLGWVAGIIAILVVVALLTDGVDDVEDADAAATIGWVRVILGMVVLLVGVKTWLGRPGPGSGPEMPKWMSAIDRSSPLTALGAGLALTALNPKNIALVAGAGTAVGAPGLTVAESIAVAATFITVASLGVALPPLYYAIGGSAARDSLEAWKAWLVANSALVMAMLMLVIGAVLVGEGLRLL